MAAQLDVEVVAPELVEGRFTAAVADEVPPNRALQ
jgi:hypothetical protein